MRRPPAELRQFLAAYDAAIGTLFLATRRDVLAAAPAATELIYDAYNAVSAAFSFTNRLKEAFCHVAAYRGHVNLGFNRGAALPDPQGLLVGSGTSIRHIRIGAVGDLQRPGVQRLLRLAAAQGRALAPARAAPSRPIVKAVFARKRRPPASQR